MVWALLVRSRYAFYYSSILAHWDTSSGSLPDISVRNMSDNLEASALRAPDICDDMRVHNLMHADGPLFLASSVGEMQRTMQLVAE